MALLSERSSKGTPSKIYTIDIGDYNRDPNVYHKNDYNPFGEDSSTWVTYYFKRERMIRGSRRVWAYESPGRDFQEARKGLVKALGDDDIEPISYEEYLTIDNKT